MFEVYDYPARSLATRSDASAIHFPKYELGLHPRCQFKQPTLLCFKNNPKTQVKYDYYAGAPVAKIMEDSNGKLTRCLQGKLGKAIYFSPENVRVFTLGSTLILHYQIFLLSGLIYWVVSQAEVPNEIRYLQTQKPKT